LGCDRETIAKGFLNGVNETVLKMTGFNLMQNKCSIETFKNEVCGIMFMKGFENALFLISTQREAAKVYISYMTGIEPENLSEDEINDGILEILNMSAGIAKSAVENCEYVLTSPVSISGDSINFKTKKFVEKYEYKLCAENMDVKIGIFYV
jgi:CheY-specific phosphatase CheX